MRIWNMTDRVIMVRVAVLYLSPSGQPLCSTPGKNDSLRLQIKPNQRWSALPLRLGRPTSFHNTVAVLLAHAQGEDHMKDFGWRLRLSSYSILIFHMDVHGGGLTLSGIRNPRFWPFQCMMISDHNDENRKATLTSRGSICSVDAYPIAETAGKKQVYY